MIVVAEDAGTLELMEKRDRVAPTRNECVKLGFTLVRLGLQMGPKATDLRLDDGRLEWVWEERVQHQTLWI